MWGELTAPAVALLPNASVMVVEPLHAAGMSVLALQR